MNSKLLLATVATISVVVWTLWPDGDPGTGSHPFVEAARGEAEPIVAGAGSTADAEPRTKAPNRQTVSSPSGRPDESFLIGRCVDAATDLPVAGLTVVTRAPKEIAVWDQFGGRTMQPNPQPSRQPQKSLTDRAGQFRVSVSAAKAHRYALTVSGLGYVPVVVENVMVRPGEIRDLGVGQMVRGRKLRGVVVDTDGRSVAGARFGLYVDVAHRVMERIGMSVLDDPELVSDSDGRFETEYPIPFGVYGARMRFPHRLAQELGQSIPVREDDAAARIVVDRDRGWIRGRVVDGLGNPISGAEVMASPRATEHRISTDAHGAFAIPRQLPTTRDAVKIRVQKPGYPLLLTAGSFSWHTDDIELVLRAGALQRFLVVDPSQQVVRGFRGQIYMHQGENTLMYVRDPEWGARGRADRGVVETRGLAPGAYSIILRVVDPGLVRTSVHQVEVGAQPQTHELHIPVADKTRIEVVRRREGTGALVPVSDATVRLIQKSDGEPYRRGLNLYDFTSLDVRGHLLRDRTAIVIDRQKTEAAGIAELSIPRVEGLHLTVEAEGFSAVHLSGAELSGRDRIVVQFESAATIRGHLSPRSVERRLRPALRLTRLDDPGVKFPESSGFSPSGQSSSHIDDKGNFELGGIPPGSWKVHLIHVNLTGNNSGSIALDYITTVHKLRPGEVRELVLDCGRLAACSLEGTAVFQGKPLPFARLSFTGKTAGVIVADADESGRFQVQITGDTYRVVARVRLGDSDETTELRLADPLEVTPGQKLERRFVLQK